MNVLGIYFGPKIISVVETKGSGVINSLQIPQFKISGSDFEEKVPEELKIVSLFKDEFSKNKIQAKEAVIAVSGKDLIVRTFDMPPIPRNELVSAVNFEVKKYIPFKVEDLISDFQVQRDKISQKNLVLFVGIKKESLDKYLAISNQLDLKISSIEYSGFSILRLLKLVKIKQRGVFAVVNIDLKEEDEVNFVVLKNGFPLFSRDIILSNGSNLDSLQSEKIDPNMMLEKLRAELRVSFDFYHRKFSTQNIEKVFFASSEAYRSELDAFIKERGLDVQFIEVAKFIGKQIPYSLSFLKAYCVSLGKIIRADLKIDLLKAKSKVKVESEISILEKKAIPSFYTTINLKIVIVALLMYLLPFVYSFYTKIPLRKELQQIISIRPKSATVWDSASYENLEKIDSDYRKKIEIVNNLIRGQLYITEILDVIPHIIPEGLWLRGMEFKIDKQNKAEITLSGILQLEEKGKALETINNFAQDLKENPIFNKYFNNVNIQSIEQIKEKESEFANFVISCHNR